MNGVKSLSVVIGITDPRSLRLLVGIPEFLASLGWDVTIVVGAKAPPVPGASVEVIPMRRNPAPLSDLIALFDWIVLLRRRRPDVVLAGTPKAGLLGTLAARIVGVPVRIYHLRGLRLETSRGPTRLLLSTLERLSMKAATEVLSVSRSLAQVICQLGLTTPERVSVLEFGSSNGVSLQEFRPPGSPAERARARFELGVADELPVIGFVGRVTPSKGVDILVDAVCILRRTHRFRLLLVGEEESNGYVSMLRIQLDAAGVEAVLTGARTDLLICYQAMDILCLPSLREGFPNVILEAAACGVPAVTTNATGCVDAVEDSVTGWITQAGDAHDLARALAVALTKPECARAAGRAARERVQHQFARETVQTALAEHLAAAVKSKSHKRGRAE